MRRTLHRLRRTAAIVRRIIGVPDYERYLAHMRCHHPERAPVGREEFFAQQLRTRYEKPGSRCC